MRFFLGGIDVRDESAGIWFLSLGWFITGTTGGPQDAIRTMLHDRREPESSFLAGHPFPYWSMPARQEARLNRKKDQLGRGP